MIRSKARQGIVMPCAVGREEGRAAGLEEGLEVGLEEGIEEGPEEGREIQVESLCSQNLLPSRMQLPIKTEIQIQVNLEEGREVHRHLDILEVLGDGREEGHEVDRDVGPEVDHEGREAINHREWLILVVFTMQQNSSFLTFDVQVSYCNAMSTSCPYLFVITYRCHICAHTILAYTSHLT